MDAFTPTNDIGGDDVEKEEGYSSSLSVGAISTILLLGAWGAISSRKKEN